MTGKTEIAIIVAAGGLLLAGCAQPPAAPAGPATETRTVTASPTAKPAPAPAPTKAKPQPAGEPGDPPECHVAYVSVAIQPGDSLGHGVFETSIVLTNHGPDSCTLYGSSRLELVTAAGAPLGIKEIQSDMDPKLITIQKGRTAKMLLQYESPYPDTPADCLPKPAFAELTLPADENEQIDAKPADPAFGMPAVCGPVTVTPWTAGR
jgi:Domain of unknown function (DUF4232)